VDFGGLFFLALMWAVFKLVSKSREVPTRPQGRPGLGPLQDPPQEEGRALRMLLKELERAAQRPGMAGHPPVGKLPSGEKVEARRTLEMTPRVIESPEAAPLRRERAEVDQDEQVEQVVAMRAAAAAARDAGRTQANQQPRDQRTDQAPAEPTATRPLTPRQLRDAIIWREILDPPVSERDR
jgi:hypothetical protein